MTRSHILLVLGAFLVAGLWLALATPGPTAEAAVPAQATPAQAAGFAAATTEAAAGAAASDLGGCLGCHSHPLTTSFEGQEVSLQIDGAKLGASPHKDVPCSLCHTSGHGPLGEVRAAAYAACSNCHGGHDFSQAAAGAATTGDEGLFVHPEPLTCASCHGPAHAVVPSSDPASPLNPAGNVEFCGSCHTKQAEAYDYSYHGAAHKLGSETAPVCATCHGHLPPVSAAAGSGALPSGSSMPTSGSSCESCHVGGQAALAQLMASGEEHITPSDRGTGADGLARWAVWKFFLLLILFNVTKDGVVAALDLVRRFREAGARAGGGIAVGGGR